MVGKEPASLTASCFRAHRLHFARFSVVAGGQFFASGHTFLNDAPTSAAFDMGHYFFRIVNFSTADFRIDSTGDATNRTWRERYDQPGVIRRIGAHVLAIFERVLAEDPRNVDARLHVAAGLVKLGDMLAATADSGARSAYRDALVHAGADDAAPPGEEARYAIANAYAGLGAIEMRAENDPHAELTARKYVVCDYCREGWRT
jgi:hypothetical protein